MDRLFPFWDYYFLKSGGQLGHKGINLPKLPEDEVIEISLNGLFCTCGGDIIPNSC